MTKKEDQSATTSSQWLSRGKNSLLMPNRNSKNVILHQISIVQIRDEPLPLQAEFKGEKSTISLRFLA